MAWEQGQEDHRETRIKAAQGLCRGRATSERDFCRGRDDQKSNFAYEFDLKIVLFLEIMHMNFRDAELASGARQTIVGLPQRIAQQEPFEGALGLLPARQLIAVKHQPVVVRKDDLLFILR